jgi:hypothetical protein
MTKWKLQGRTIVLDEFNSLLWDDSSPAAIDLRREVRADAQIVATSIGQTIEIHSHDDYTLDAVQP